MALQFAGEYQLYGHNIFSRRGIDELGKMRPGEPNALQPERARALYDVLKDYDKRDLARLQRTVAVRALNAGQRVFVLLPGSASADRLRWTNLDAADGRTLEARQVACWSDPAAEWLLLEVTPEGRAMNSTARGGPIVRRAAPIVRQGVPSDRQDAPSVRRGAPIDLSAAPTDHRRAPILRRLESKRP